MADPTGGEERHIAMPYAAMKAMHAALKDKLGQLQAAVDDAHAASAEIEAAGEAIVPAVTQAAARAVDASVRRAVAELAAPARSALDQYRAAGDGAVRTARGVDEADGVVGAGGSEVVLVQVARRGGGGVLRSERGGVGGGGVAAA